VLSSYCLCDKIEEDGMGGACGTCGEKTSALVLAEKKPEGRNHVENLDINDS